MCFCFLGLDNAFVTTETTSLLDYESSSVAKQIERPIDVAFFERLILAEEQNRLQQEKSNVSTYGSEGS